MRGKHAALTRNKQEADERFAQAVTELRRTKEKLEDERKLRSEIEALRQRLEHIIAQRDQATSPALVRAEARIKKLTQELREQREEYRSLSEKYVRLYGRFRDGQEATVEGLEEVFETVTGETAPVVTKGIQKRNLSLEGVVRIQRARGVRKSEVDWKPKGDE